VWKYRGWKSREQRIRAKKRLEWKYPEWKRRVRRYRE
jgi:hypothetical protein